MDYLSTGACEVLTKSQLCHPRLPHLKHALTLQHRTQNQVIPARRPNRGITLKSSMQHAIMSISNQDDTNFFILPRELRDDIYHHLLSPLSCMYYAYLPPSNPPIVPLYFQLRYTSASTTSRKPHHEKATNKLTWLLSCKVVYHEGLAQYLRHAEWVWRRHYRHDAHAHIRPWNTHLATLNVTRIELQVCSLAHYGTPHRNEGTDTRDYLTRIAACMRATGVRIERLRFVGHSYYLKIWPREPRPEDQVGIIMANLRDMFTGVEISKFELDVVGRPTSNACWVKGPG